MPHRSADWAEDHAGSESWLALLAFCEGFVFIGTPRNCSHFGVRQKARQRNQKGRAKNQSNKKSVFNWPPNTTPAPEQKLGSDVFKKFAAANYLRQIADNFFLCGAALGHPCIFPLEFLSAQPVLVDSFLATGFRV